MIKKISIFLVLLLLLLSISVVSAADDNNTNLSSDETDYGELEVSDEIISQDSFSSITSASSHTINSANYGNYFDNDGKLVSSSVKTGDTVNLDGSFSNVNFTFDRQLTIKGTSSNSMSNSVVTLLSGASGSTIANLNIKNTNQYTYGVFLNGVQNSIVKNCHINNTGAASYTICIANGANNNQIIDNDLTAYGETYGAGHGSRSTPPIVVSGSHNNYIANNNIKCDDANGIYLSSYSAGPVNGGESNFNRIYNNTIKYNVLPTSWSYGIQVMGNNNTVNFNTIIGAYRGISSASGSGIGGNIIINNKILNITGANYINPNVATGGENAIVGTYNSTIRNNTIENALISGSGSAISVLDNSIVENNYIQVVNSSGKGINAWGSNVLIKNNVIFTYSGSGVFQQSNARNLRVENNNITSNSAIGILITKVSSKERPSAVIIINNNISTNAIYIIDASEVESDSLWVIEGNKNGLILTPNGTYDSSRPTYIFNGTVYNITPTNYGEYINDNGILSSSIQDGDILNFAGVFSDKIIKINSQVKITGQNPIFYNSTFRIISGGVWIENITIKNKNASRFNAWGILVNNVDNGVTILNNNIEIYDSKAAYAIYIVDSGMVDVIGNKLFSSGDFLTYTLLAYSASDCRFINNTITTIGTGESYGVENEHCLDGDETCMDGDDVCLDGSEFCVDGSHIVPEIHRTYGILMIYSSDNNVSGNKVNVTSDLTETLNNAGVNSSKNTIIGIDLYYNSHDNVFSNNDVYVNGMDNYIYGMGVLGHYTGHNAPIGGGAFNNQFISNNIFLEGTYFTTGIIVGSESKDTIVKNNIIYLKSNNVSYGITLELSQKSNVINNTLTLNSDIIYGIEIYNSNENIISNNFFNDTAKKVYGLAFANSNNNNITNNVIIANSTGEEIIGHEFDSIIGPYAGIYLKSNSSNNIIKDNNITSTKGYAINIGDMANDNIIINNYLNSEEGIANGAVNNSGNNNVSNNYFYLITGSFNNTQIQYLEYGNIIFNVSDDLIDALEGANVEFYVSNEYIGSVNLTDGVASINYKFEQDYTPAQYPLSVIVSKEDYKVTEFESLLTITPGNLYVEVTNVSAKSGLRVKYIAKVTNSLGNPVSGLTVMFYREVDGIFARSGSNVTDKNGIVTVYAGMLPSGSNGNYTIEANISSSDYYLPSDGVGYLTILDIAPVYIKINTKLSYGAVLATLTDNNGFAVEYRMVSINIAGVTYTLKTNVNGEVILPINKVGTYAVSVKFNSDGVYESKSLESKITVLAPLSGNKNYQVFYGSTVQYKLRVIGSDGNYVGSGKVVTIKVNGKTYNLKTDKNSYVTQNIKLGVGKYTVTAKYNGYTVSSKITFKSILSAKNIVKKKSKKVKFQAKLVDKNGKILKNKKIIFKINSKKYTAKTNKKGIATVTIKNLKIGKFTITSSYGGCTIKNTIKIKK